MCWLYSVTGTLHPKRILFNLIPDAILKFRCRELRISLPFTHTHNLADKEFQGCVLACTEIINRFLIISDHLINHFQYRTLIAHLPKPLLLNDILWHPAIIE